MLAYRHAFHAGNHADVLKHMLLPACALYKDRCATTVELADWPPMESLPLHGDARAATCGSTLGLDISPDAAGRIETLGLRVRACACVSVGRLRCERRARPRPR